MSILRFRRDRRARDPFAGTPLDREPAAQPPAPDYGTRIDVDTALAEIAAQAARPPWATAPQPAATDLPEAHARHGRDITSIDVAPRHDRPYIPGVLGSDGRLSPRRAGIAEDLGSLTLFRAAVGRMARPCCGQCREASGTWQERLYGTYRHHTRAVPEAAPRQFGIATELRQAHERAAAAAEMAERTFAAQYQGRAA